MKFKFLQLASCLAFAALSLQAPGQNTAPPPTNANTGTEEPCGNPAPTDPPPCPDDDTDDDCDKKDSKNYDAAGSSCETNSINSYNGNAHRKVTDLQISGSVGKMPLAFKRFSNTRLSSRNLAQSAFGKESPWSHNFEWIMRDNGGTVAQPIIKVTYPEGKERSFVKSATTNTWVPTIPYKNPDRIISSGDDFVLNTGDLKQVNFKRRIHSVTSGVFYRIESIKDPESNAYTISYNNNDDTLVPQITDPAAHWIKLNYADESIRSATSTKLNQQPITGGTAWSEINVTPGQSFRILAYYMGNDQGNSSIPRVAELEFYDENNVKINGTTIGSTPWNGSNELARATDGNTSTFYQYAYRKAGYVGIDLGAGNAKKVSRIRYIITGSMNPDASFLGMNNDPVSNYVVSHVEGSDGRQVDYDYLPYTEPSGVFQWVQLSQARYTDLTTSAYTYNSQRPYVMPVLETANDPRYPGSVKQVRYGYSLNTVVGFVVDESDDASGQLVVSVRWDNGHTPKLVYPNGKANRFEYWGGNLRRAVDSFGAATDYTNMEGFVTSEKDPLNRITTYGRRGDRRLTSTTTPGGFVTTYTLDTPGYITAIRKNGKTTGYILDPTTKRRTRTNHPDGSFETWTYNTFGQKLTHRLRNATTESWIYNTAGLLTSQINPAGLVTDFTYNSLNRLASETRRLNPSTAHTTTYEYDDRGSLTKMTHPDSTFVQHVYDDYGNRTNTLDERGQLTQWTYDSLSRKLTETDPNGNTTAYNYTSSLGGGCGCNTRGLPVTITYPDGTVTLNSYDKEWRLLSTTLALGTPQAATTSYGYDLAGQKTSMTDPLGRITTYTYDVDGRLISETHASGTAVALTNTRTYSVDGNLLSATQGAGSPAAATTTMTYDVMDRTITTTAAFGTPSASTTARSYNNLGQLVSSTDPLSRITTYAYDATGRQTDIILPGGTTFRTVYDAFSRTTQSIAALGLPVQAVTSMTYDRLSRTLTVKDALNNTTTYTYDLAGNHLTTRAADNLITSTRTYDARDRLTSEKDGKNQTISYQYDALGRQTAYTDAKGATFSFQFDPLGRLTRRTEPNSTFQTYTYDAASRLLVHTKADATTKTHHYENAARDFLTKITYSTGEAPRLMSYDALGKLLTAANAHSSITRSYDPAGRQLSETQALTGGPTGTFAYQYDTDGNLTRHTRPDGSFIDYQYNLRNLLSSVISDAPPPVASYTYNARNQIASTVIENGLFTAARSYDAAGRLTGVTNGTLDSTGYTLSPDGRRTGINRNGQAETYGYDNARQVTSAAYPDLTTTQSWNYDAAGNRTSSQFSNSQISNQTTTYLANTVNEYTSITGAPAPPMYDANGNAISYPVKPLGSSSLVSCVLSWDINNQLIAASNGAGDSATYQYDALGRRTKLINTVNSVNTVTYFFTNGWNVELEHNGSTYTRRNTWGLDLSNSPQGAGGVGGLVMVEELPPGGGAPVPNFPTYDGNGNITAWVNASGTVIARQRYDAYGNIIDQTGTPPSNYGFSTKPQDQVTGLLYYGYRYYDPVTGRWPSRDPIEERGGVNLYEFVGNSSIYRFDVLGLQAGKFGCKPCADQCPRGGPPGEKMKCERECRNAKLSMKCGPCNKADDEEGGGGGGGRNYNCGNTLDKCLGSLHEIYDSVEKRIDARIKQKYRERDEGVISCKNMCDRMYSQDWSRELCKIGCSEVETLKTTAILAYTLGAYSALDGYLQHRKKSCWESYDRCMGRIF